MHTYTHTYTSKHIHTQNRILFITCYKNTHKFSAEVRSCKYICHTSNYLSNEVRTVQ
uniref:Uncharacterized protein n=1 Tax=Anguilla anguilla TaxID=7936 RepID=A0A0E9UWY2_ANGAN